METCRALARWLAGSAILLYLGIHLVRDTEPSSGAVDVALLATAGAGVLVNALTATGVRDVIGRRPRIVAARTVSMSMSLPPGGTADAAMFLSVPFFNCQDGGGERATARDVVATVEILEPTGFLETRSHGRWGAEFGYDDFTEGPRCVDFPPTHEKRLLNVVGLCVRHDGTMESLAHLLGADVYKALTIGPAVPVGNWRLRVTLRGSNLHGPRRFSYVLAHDEQGVRLTPVPAGWRTIVGRLRRVSPSA